MRIKWTRFQAWIVGLVALAGVGILTACDIGSSASTATRNVQIFVEGFYARVNGEPIVSRTSGAPVVSLNLRQDGDQLEAIDNNGVVFRGTLGQVVDDSRASFTMEGRSTAGNRATIAGNFAVANRISTMTGSWIEDSLVGQVVATALVPTNAVPDDGNGTNTTVAITPTSANLTVGQTATFTASGGTGTFTWSLSNESLAGITISGDRDSIATLTARAAGTVILRVRDGSVGQASTTASVNISATLGEIDTGASTGPLDGGNGVMNVADSESGTSRNFPSTPGPS